MEREKENKMIARVRSGLPVQGKQAREKCRKREPDGWGGIGLGNRRIMPGRDSQSRDTEEVEEKLPRRVS